MVGNILRPVLICFIVQRRVLVAAMTDHTSSMGGSVTTTAVNSSKTIRIGYLLQDFEPPYRAGAINLAIEQAQMDGMLQGYNFSLTWKTTICEERDGLFALLGLLQYDNVDVVFGPACSQICDSGGFVVAFWNRPFFPEWCSAIFMDDKAEYDTMIRVAGSYARLGMAFKAIMLHYQWRRVALISDSDKGTCLFAATAIQSQLDYTNDDFSLVWLRFSTSPSEQEFDTLLGEIVNQFRAIIVCHTSTSVVQSFLFHAQDANMTGGQYVFWTFSRNAADEVLQPWTTVPAAMNQTDVQKRRSLFYSVKTVTYADIGGSKADEFLRRVRLASSQPPWNFNSTVQPDYMAQYLYDAVYLYLMVINEMISNGENLADGLLVYNRTLHKKFNGSTGYVEIDENGDRAATFTMWTYGPGYDSFHPYADIDPSKDNEQAIRVVDGNIVWGSAVTPPAEIRRCDSAGVTCDNTILTANNNTTLIIVICVVAIVLVLAAVVSHYIRVRILANSKHHIQWKLDVKYLIPVHESLLMSSTRTPGSFMTHTGSDYGFDGVNGNNFSYTHAIYNGQPVTVCRSTKHEIALTQKDLTELIKLKELSHDNILPFIGASIEPGKVCFVVTRCNRGTLEDIIEDSNINLDWVFRISFISDLVNGMLFLHKSSFHSHGRLTSAQCHVDSRWVLRIGGFGLHAFREAPSEIHLDDANDENACRKSLWTAPELLRMRGKAPVNGTQKADVYSFAIIMQEIIYRAQPYFCDRFNAAHIVQRVVADSPPHYRPTPEKEDEKNPGLVSLMKRCWAENPNDRPYFDVISKQLRTINGGRQCDIVDNMLHKLEKYADNLENLVRQRTAELEGEKLKTEALLYQMLPPFVADKLRLGQTVQPELYSSTTIYFSDIVGFTTLSSTSSPFQVVDLLNDLYGMFDDAISHYDVYKVETIGDAYMVVSGLPRPNEGRHICEICNMALALLEEVSRFKMRHRPNETLQLRIGIHTGPCAAGVVGHAMPRYCLFGDTVNTASRMESTGEALRIHLSQDAHNAAQEFSDYVTEFRGMTHVKGKGELPTFWLLGKQPRVVENVRLSQ